MNPSRFRWGLLLIQIGLILIMINVGLIDDDSVLSYIENCASRDQNSDIRSKAKNILRRRKK